MTYTKMQALPESRGLVCQNSEIVVSFFLKSNYFIIFVNEC